MSFQANEQRVWAKLIIMYDQSQAMTGSAETVQHRVADFYNAKWNSLQLVQVLLKD